MHAEIEDFKTGWYGINISIRKHEIDVLIKQLKQLKQNKQQHFHISSDYEGDGGLGDVEFSIQEDVPDNMSISGFAISPNR
ncbi:MAG: hypothetical protein D3918_13810 [Candidatus Electrothrix sp. AX2]|nr:hypothetical protein [Candidatus Electrothrix gigas]